MPAIVVMSAIRTHPAYAFEVIADEQVIVGVDRNALRIAHAAGSRQAVSGEGALTGSCDRCDDAGSSVDLADPAVVVVCDEHVARRIDGDGYRLIQQGIGGGPAVSRISAIPPMPAIVVMVPLDTLRMTCSP